MIYCNPEYSFKFDFDPYTWLIKETCCRKTFSVELFARSAANVKIGIKAVSGTKKKLKPKDYFEYDKFDLRKIFGEFEIIYQKEGLHKGKNFHEVKFRAGETTCIRFLFLDGAYVYLFSLICPNSKAVTFENIFSNILDSAKTGTSVRKGKIESFDVYPNFFYITLKEGGRLLTGDIAIKTHEQGIVVNTIEVQCIDSNEKVAKNIIHQVGELTLFGRQILPRSIFRYTNIAPKGTTLNFLLPNEMLSDSYNIERFRLCLSGRTESGNIIKKCVKISSQLYNGNELSFPLTGRWLVTNGPGLYGIHREACSCRQGRVYSPQRFALDLVKVDKNLRTFRNKGSDNVDYHAFSEIVYAPSQGKIIKVVSDVSDNPPRDRNWMQPRGNHVIIEINSSRYVLLAHLRKNSIRVGKGDVVKERDVIGEVGNSGRSSEPHLHIHLSDSPHPRFSQGLPIIFKTIGFLLSGDIYSDFC